MLRYFRLVLFAGNGDVLSYEDALLRRQQTGVAGLMIARLAELDKLDPPHVSTSWKQCMPSCHSS